MKILLSLIVLASFAQAQTAWHVSKSTNALTGEATVMAFTSATDYPGAKDHAPKLVARQTGKTCDLFVNVPYKALRDYARIRYDHGKIESPKAMISDDHEAVFLFGQFEEIKISSKLVVEYATNDETPLAVTFLTRGLPAQFDSCVVSERKEIAAERKEAAEVAAREKDFEELRASAEAKKRKDLCELPSFASDPKFCDGVGVPVPK